MRFRAFARHPKDNTESCFVTLWLKIRQGWDNAGHQKDWGSATRIASIRRHEFCTLLRAPTVMSA